MMRKILLRLYPAAWRKEYGEEFADLLASNRLTFGAVANVLWSAARQRLRHAPAWFLAGMWLLLFTATRILLQGFGLMSLRDDANFEPVMDLLLAQTGFRLAARKNGSFIAGLTGTIKAGLLCKLPVVAMFFLFFSTSTFRNGDGQLLQMHSRLEAFGWMLFGVVGSGVVLGCCGAICGSVIRRFRGRLA